MHEFILTPWEKVEQGILEELLGWDLTKYITVKTSLNSSSAEELKEKRGVCMERIRDLINESGLEIDTYEDAYNLVRNQSGNTFARLLLETVASAEISGLLSLREINESLKLSQ